MSNIASRVPWDADPHTGATTDTTTGNNATTGEAWVSPLTAGGAHQQPQEPTRAYSSRGRTRGSTRRIRSWQPRSEGVLSDGAARRTGNDILAAVTNLFVGHNRMHDFSYILGFTETNYNAQSTTSGTPRRQRKATPKRATSRQER